VRTPDYAGGALVNLAAELERRLTGDAPNAGLHAELADAIPEAESYVLVLFDGLGDHQLAHPKAEALRAARAGAIEAGFPTTTTVSMATLATGLTPAEHGLVGYQMWLPEADLVVNTIKWTTQWGDAVDVDTGPFLPSPNLWERLAAAGREPVTLQPWGFDASPMSRLLYRGCRFEPWSDEDEAADAAAELAALPGRLVFLYVPHVDFAAHVSGQESEDYEEALSIVDRLWGRLTRSLPHGAVAIGTADHGHVDIAEDRRILIPKTAHEESHFGGDPRAPFVYGDVSSVAEDLGVAWEPRTAIEGLWGPGERHPQFNDRIPDGLLLPDPGWVVFHRYADERLIGQHGGLTDEELRVPVLVGA
jgi:predicted AlkP superfamily pyrophosphatase or phosphodiesterase